MTGCIPSCLLDAVTGTEVSAHPSAADEASNLARHDCALPGQLTCRVSDSQMI